MKQVRGIWISPCAGRVGQWGRSKRAPASKSSGLGGRLNDWLHLVPVLCHPSQWGCGWGNALWSLEQMLLWIGLCWCLTWKLNAPKTSIFVDVFLARYFENMNKSESFWYCDSRAILKVTLRFIKKKKKLRDVQGLVQLWSLNSFQYGVGLTSWFREDFIRFVQEASCSLKC